MKKFTDLYVMREALKIKSSNDVIEAIKSGEMVKNLNGKKNLPTWIKEAIESNEQSTIDFLLDSFETLISKVHSILGNVTSGTECNESIFLLIKKSSDRATMSKILKNSMDTLIYVAKSATKAWYKGLPIVQKVNNEPYNPETWHELEKTLQDTLANSRQRNSSNKTDLMSKSNENDLYTVLYQDDNWFLAKPKNFNGDKFLASNLLPEKELDESGNPITKTHWCTAADIGLYESYSEDGNGYYIIKTPGLKNAENAWQIAFCSKSHVEFMDRFDSRNFYEDFISKAPDGLLSKIVVDNPKSLYCNIVSLLDFKNEGLSLTESALDNTYNRGSESLNKKVIDKKLSEYSPKIKEALSKEPTDIVRFIVSDIPDDLIEFVVDLGVENVIQETTNRDYPEWYEYDRDLDKYKLKMSENFLNLLKDSNWDIRIKRRLISSGLDHELSVSDFKEFMNSESCQYLTKILLNIDSQYFKSNRYSDGHFIRIYQDFLNKDVNDIIKFAKDPRFRDLSVSDKSNVMNAFKSGLDLKQVFAYIRVLDIIKKLSNINLSFTLFERIIISFSDGLGYETVCKGGIWEVIERIEHYTKKLPKIISYINDYSSHYLIVIKRLSNIESISKVETDIVNKLLEFTKTNDKTINVESTLGILRFIRSMLKGNEPINIDLPILFNLATTEGKGFDSGDLQDNLEIVNSEIVDMPFIKDFLYDFFIKRSSIDLENLIDNYCKNDELDKDAIKYMVNQNYLAPTDIANMYVKDVKDGKINPDIISLYYYGSEGRNNAFYYNKIKSENLVDEEVGLPKNINKNTYEAKKFLKEHPEYEKYGERSALEFMISRIGLERFLQNTQQVDELGGYVTAQNIEDFGYEECKKYVEACKANDIDVNIAPKHIYAFTNKGIDAVLNIIKDSNFKKDLEALEEKLPFGIHSKDKMTDTVKLKNAINQVLRIPKAAYKNIGRYLTGEFVYLTYNYGIDNLKNALLKFHNIDLTKSQDNLDYKFKAEVISPGSSDMFDSLSEHFKPNVIVGLKSEVLGKYSSEQLLQSLEKIKQDFGKSIKDYEEAEYLNIYLAKPNIYKKILENKEGLHDWDLSMLISIIYCKDISDTKYQEVGFILKSRINKRLEIELNLLLDFDLKTLQRINKLSLGNPDIAGTFINMIRYVIAYHGDLDFALDFLEEYYTDITRLIENKQVNISYTTDLKILKAFIDDINAGHIKDLGFESYELELSRNPTKEELQLNVEFLNNTELVQFYEEYGERTLKSLYIQTNGGINAKILKDYEDACLLGARRIIHSSELILMFINNKEEFDYVLKLIRDGIIEDAYYYKNVKGKRIVNDYYAYKAKGGIANFEKFEKRFYLEETFKSIYRMSRI